MPNLQIDSSEVVTLPDRSSLAREAAMRFVAHARDAIQSNSRFSVALSGGSTPRDMLTLLAAPEFASQITWAHVHVFWGDERAVPPDSSDSNYRMARDALLAHVPIPAENVHPIRAELPPEDAAREYDSARSGREWAYRFALSAHSRLA
jgi:6-phosphogluconolactonase